MNTYNIGTTQHIDASILHNMLDDALDRDIAYWAASTHGDVAEMMAGTEPFKVTEAEGGRTYTLTRDMVLQGLEKMAAQYPRAMAYLLDADYDATTGDMLVQLALFGDLVFG